ncbi:MAG: carboxy-S-adenosyl-L-methionine synthase CmoA [Citrobacter freundii]|nr:MAG: carboxy-S-adenosyl-L-methionine synthase CmoA [Citrobacter freundii]
MEKDQIFNEGYSKPSDFKFNPAVAGVFDDMVNRSVPFYEEIQRMVAELAATSCVSEKDAKVYDLGCSTGTTMAYMHSMVSLDVTFIGVDDSDAMLEKCRYKLDALFGGKRAYFLSHADLTEDLAIEDASVVILCLTLQFVRPINREKLLKRIFDGLRHNGVLILVEKVLAEESEFNRDFIRFYYDLKRRHQYSELEISQKREALENVLIPYKLSENVLLLRNAGFEHCEVFFKWYNFAGLVAKKSL